ncbi:MAG: O-antigen ligase family protein [Dehalococcoidia bacterium]|nr:O-antigen ligase family protein [Dehalococcoidia bacterium]
MTAYLSLVGLRRFDERTALVLALSGGVILATSVPSVEVSAALVAGAIVLIAVIIRPVIGLYSLAFSVPFGSGIGLPVGSVIVSATDALVGVTAFAWLAGLCTRRYPKIYIPPLMWPLILMLSAFILSTSNAPSISLGLHEIIKWLEVAAVLLVASSVLNSKNTRLGIMFAVLIAAALEALLGLAQSLLMLGPAGFLLGEGFLRAYGTFGQPNPYAGYLVASAAFGVGLAAGAFGLGGWRSWLAGAAAVTGPVAIILAGAAASMSRGGALAFVAVAGISSLRDRRTVTAVLAVFSVALALVLSGVRIPLPESLANRLDVTLEYFRLFDARTVQVTPENFPLVQRMALWQSAWYMFLSSPMTGVGVGNFDMLYQYFALPDWSSYLLGHAHNYYLNLLAETGIVGFMSYIVFIVSIFVCCLKTIRGHSNENVRWMGAGRRVEEELPRHSPSVRKEGGAGAIELWTSPAAIAWAVMAFLTALSVHALFDNLYVHGIPILLGLLIGLLSAVMAGRGRTEENWS